MAINVLVLMIGLPRSGKSTWARGRGWPIVNPDSIRLALHGQRFYAPAEPMVWALAQLMVEALFRAGNDIVILDATNITAKQREMWAGRGWDVTVRVMHTSPQECKRRAKAEGDTEIIPVIDRMAAEWDLPRPREWDEGSPDAS